MYLFDLAMWLLFGFSLAVLHIQFMERRPVPTLIAGMFGAVCGGLLVRVFALPRFDVVGFSMSGMVLAGVGAEALILLAGKGGSVGRQQST